MVASKTAAMDQRSPIGLLVQVAEKHLDPDAGQDDAEPGLQVPQPAVEPDEELLAVELPGGGNYPAQPVHEDVVD